MIEVSQSSFNINLTKSNIQQDKSILLLQQQIRNEMMQLEKIYDDIKSSVNIQRSSSSMSVSVQFTQKQESTNKDILANNKYSIFFEDDKKQASQILANIGEISLVFKQESPEAQQEQKNVDNQKIEQNFSFEKQHQKKNQHNFNQQQQKLSQYFKLSNKFIIQSKTQTQSYRQKCLITTNVIFLLFFLAFYSYYKFFIAIPQIQQEPIQQYCLFLRSKDNPIVEEWLPQIKKYKNDKNFGFIYDRIDQILKRHIDQKSAHIEISLFKQRNQMLKKNPIPQLFEEFENGPQVYQYKNCQYLIEQINEKTFQATQYYSCYLNAQKMWKRLEKAQQQLNKLPESCYELFPGSKKLQQSLFLIGNTIISHNFTYPYYEKALKIKKYYQKAKQLILKSKKSQIQEIISYFGLVYEISILNIKYLSQIKEAKQNLKQLKNISPHQSQKLSYLRQCIKIRQFVSSKQLDYNKFRKFVRNLPQKLERINKINNSIDEVFNLNIEEIKKLTYFSNIAMQYGLDRNWMIDYTTIKNHSTNTTQPGLLYCGQYQNKIYKCYQTPLLKYDLQTNSLKF